MTKNSGFSFNISLSVLNHLGRNLYRSFSTVLGEAISNAWDADAKNVYISIDKNKNSFSIRDDGIGMTSDDFQKKFLVVGYSKRKNGSNQSALGRPYIGRKGIGKLALLSCADQITVISKTLNSDVIGGVIDNAALDGAIKEDKEQYDLLELSTFDKELTLFPQGQGTYIRFDNIKKGIAHNVDYLRKVIALYFRFSVLDNSFNIFVNDKKITEKDLDDLVQKTEFVWDINETPEDQYLNVVKTAALSKDKGQVVPTSFQLKNGDTVTGFIVSVEKPADLKIKDSDEAVTVDLFVNGRLREKDILKHIRSRRIPESYLYGQINYNALDDDEDRFTSSRESIKAEDPKFQDLINNLKGLLRDIMDQWDDFRVEKREDGDPDNIKKLPKKERRARELFNETSKEYQDKDSSIKDEVTGWLDMLGREAQFNFPSYSECFISENLIRKYIDHKNKELSRAAKSSIAEYRRREEESKNNGGISTIKIRKNDDDTSYLDMTNLANFVDKGEELFRLSARAKTYKPPRDALMHTALLSDDAKKLLTTIFNEIKARIRALLK